MKKTIFGAILLTLLWAATSFAYQNAEELKALQQKAETGNARAQAALGDYYANVYEDANREDNYEEALKWYEKAAVQGEQYSQVMLAQLYYRGEHVAKDLDKAFKWAEVSAKAGINDTQVLLAYMYKNGEGVIKDLQQAYMWFHISLKYAYDELRPHIDKEMNELEKVLTKDQIAAAKKAAEQYK